LAVNQEIKILQHRLDEHIEEFNLHTLEEEKRWEQLISVQEANNRAISDLAESTRGLVEVWEAASGAIKVGNAIGRFAKWLTTIAVIGAAFTWVMEKFSN